MKPPAVIRLEHVYRQPPAKIWRALTDPELHARWWAKGDVKAEVGHHFTLDMGPFGHQPCEVLEVIAERRLKYSFAPGTLNTTITWILEPAGDGTKLTLIHEGFDLDSPLGQQAFKGMGSGWPGILGRLDQAV
jgi:uncharacterized protein YndB with AHSA1/START domain